MSGEKNNTNDKPKNNRHILIGVIVLLGVAALIGVAILLGNRDEISAEDLKRYTNDASRLASAVSEYQLSNNGRFPSDASKLVKDYVRGSFAYSVSFATLSEGETEKLPAESNTMYVINSAGCDGNQAIYKGNKRSFAVMYHAPGSYVICVE